MSGVRSGSPTPDTQHLTSDSFSRLLALALSLYCLFLVLVSLVGALAPPNGDDWDSLAYHLAAPKIYLSDGRIAFIPYDSHTNFPFTMEMLYTVGLAFGGAAGAKLFHWAAGWLTALGIAAFCRRLFPPGSRVAMPHWGPSLAAALFLSIPQVQWQATTAYIDLGTTLYQFLALVAFVYAVSGVQAIGRSDVRPDSPERLNTSLPWFIVCGLMSGWAMGTKMTALIPFGLLVLAAAVWAVVPHIHPEARRRSEAKEVRAASAPSGRVPAQRVMVIRSGTRAAGDGHQSRWVGVVVLAVVGVLVASPWYVKSYLWTNNPVYPFFYSLFPRSINWTPQAEIAYRMEQSSFGLGKGLGDLLMAPWNLAMKGWAFFNVPSLKSVPGSLPFFDGLQRGGLSASFLGLVPLALFTRQWDRRLTGLILYSLALLLPWFVLSQQSRYLLPVVASLAVVSAVVVANLASDLPRWTAGAFVGLVLVLHGFWGWENVALRALPVVTGQITRDEYLRRTLQPYEASQFINSLPPGTKVALYQETRGFYIDREYLWANPLQHTLIPYEQLSSGADLVRFLRTQLGVTHVLINRPLADKSKDTVWYLRLQDAIDQGNLVPVFASHKVEVYALAEDDA